MNRLLPLLLLLALDAQAGDRLRLPATELLPAPRERPQTEFPATLSPSEAARIAQQQNGGGRVLSVEPSGGGYRVKLLKDGNVRVLQING